MSVIYNIANLRNISVHPISLEEIGEWDHVSVVENIDNRVDALKEMYRIRAENLSSNLILWFDPDNPANRDLSEDILDGWESDIFVRALPIEVAAEEVRGQVLEENKDDPDYLTSKQPFLDYVLDLTMDVRSVFIGSILAMDSGTDFVIGKEDKHPDFDPKEQIRIVSTLHGDSTYVAKNSDIVRSGTLFNFKNPYNVDWYELPRGVLALILNIEQREDPIIHTPPFALHVKTTDSEKPKNLIHSPKRYFSRFDITEICEPT